MKKAAAIIFRSLILILLGVTIGLIISDDGFPVRHAFSNKDKISRIIQLVNDNYVDTVNINRIEGDAINNVLQNLDPHSVYLPPRQAQSINERLEGGFQGIGIEYQLLRDTLFITQIYPGGPAARAGLQAGDRIVTINHRPFSGTHLSVDRVNKVFRGQKNTVLQLGVENVAGKGDVHNYQVTRGHVELSSMDAAYMAAPGVGYIKLSKFAATTDTDFRTE